MRMAWYNNDMNKKPIIVLALSVMIASAAFAARPVARWDVVPDQRITGVFKAGVVAFHKTGVKVEFEYAGKKFVAENPTLNDRVNMWEYVCPIDTAALKHGVELQCVPTYVNGNPYPAGPRPVGAYAR